VISDVKLLRALLVFENTNSSSYNFMVGLIIVIFFRKSEICFFYL